MASMQEALECASCDSMLLIRSDAVVSIAIIKLYHFELATGMDIFLHILVYINSLSVSLSLKLLHS